VFLFCRSFQANLDYYRLLSKVQPPLKKAGADAVSRINSNTNICSVHIVQHVQKNYLFCFLHSSMKIGKFGERFLAVTVKGMLILNSATS